MTIIGVLTLVDRLPQDHVVVINYILEVIELLHLRFTLETAVSGFASVASVTFSNTAVVRAHRQA